MERSPASRTGSLSNGSQKILTYFPFLLIPCMVLLSCQDPRNGPEHVERAFYYWKSEPSQLGKEEMDAIDKLGIDKLYIKFFEVVPDERFGNKPVSKSSLRIDEKEDAKGEREKKLFSFQEAPEIVPTVYIKNEVLKDISSQELDTLGDNILHLCDKYYREHFGYGYDRKSYHELQIDCDWTPVTEEAYFALLKTIQESSEKRVSVTLRLYPYKYPEKMGVPPVDRATLMCYNLFHPLKFKSKNSVQDKRELKKYLKSADPYPLPLDVALPFFSRIHVYKNKRPVGYLEKEPSYVEPFCQKIEPLWYEVRQDTVAGDHYLRKGDRLKIERSTKDKTERMISLIKEQLRFDDTTCVSFFHLDAARLKQSEHETLLHHYRSFTD